MVTFYLFFGIVYGAVLLWLESLWTGMDLSSKKDPIHETLSILIPFRNECDNLPSLFSSLLALEHRPFEVVFIDDHSDDEGWKMLQKLIIENEDLDIRFSIVQNKGQGKKEAIETGIGTAIGEIILTTDADCLLPPNWIGTYIASFRDQKLQFLAGPVMSRGQSNFLEVFQQIEWGSILLLTQSGFALSQPFMCSAANMGYRKEAFLKVGAYAGNKAYLSGDDEFLLKKIIQAYGGGAAGYLQGNPVRTKPETTWKRLFAQRARWASKWKVHGSLGHALLALVPFLMQLFFLGSLALWGLGWLGILVFFYLWAVKILIERKVLGRVLKDFGLRYGIIYYLLTSIWHPFYVLNVGLQAAFGKIQWKGRNSTQFN